MKKRRKRKYDSLVGGLGGGGVALVLRSVLDVFLHPEHYFSERTSPIIFEVFLVQMVAGFILLILAAVYYLKGLIEELAEKVEKLELEASRKEEVTH